MKDFKTHSSTRGWVPPITEPAVPAQSAPTPPDMVCRHCGKAGRKDERTGALIHAKKSDFTACGNAFSPIPPTSAPGSAGGYKSHDQVDRDHWLETAKHYEGKLTQAEAEIADLKRQLDEARIEVWNEAIGAAAKRADQWEAGGEGFDGLCSATIRALAKESK